VSGVEDGRALGDDVSGTEAGSVLVGVGRSCDGT
jgi:hypothetical protein